MIELLLALQRLLSPETVKALILFTSIGLPVAIALFDVVVATVAASPNCPDADKVIHITYSVLGGNAPVATFMKAIRCSIQGGIDLFFAVTILIGGFCIICLTGETSALAEHNLIPFSLGVATATILTGVYLMTLIIREIRRIANRYIQLVKEYREHLLPPQQ